jgi:endonuclease YncB( thermonuclease family)
MFGWGRKSDGFEWHEYVRTTIKLRREDRRARFLDAKDVAADGLKYAGRASVVASSSGATSVWNGLISAIQLMIRYAIAGRHAMARTMERSIAPAGRSLLSILDPYLKRLARSPAPLMLCAAGAVALHAAFARSRGGGSRSELILAAAVGFIALTVAVAPLLTGHVKWSVLRSGLDRANRAVPGLKGLTTGQRRGLAIATLLALFLGGGYLVTRSGVVSLARLPKFASFMPFGAPPVEGRATVVAGDVIRIGNTNIRLSGIEAPDANQKCLGANKKAWACGEAARNAVGRIVKNKTVRCELSGTDETGQALGSCLTVNTGSSQNLAAELVKEGAVFSAGGLFAGFGTLEAEAKAKKLGLWRGEAEKPSEYRAKVWEAAAKAAPDGCPIKGQVAGDAKTYVLPWSPEYNAVRVRATRGERWFCSEVEAQAAGWKAGGK